MRAYNNLSSTAYCLPFDVTTGAMRSTAPRTAPRAPRVFRSVATTPTSTFVGFSITMVLALSFAACPTAAARAPVDPLLPGAAVACDPLCRGPEPVCRCPTQGDVCRAATSYPGGAAPGGGTGVCVPLTSIVTPATQLPRVREALATGVMLEGVGLAFAPAGRGLLSTTSQLNLSRFWSLTH